MSGAVLELMQERYKEKRVLELMQERDELLAALLRVLRAFETCIGKAAFAEFVASNPEIIAAKAAIARSLNHAD